MAFFEFHQNNSGGSFDHDAKRGIGHLVVVEADDALHANYRAERAGIYFDGCATGGDCPCCGDRWSRQWESAKGTDEPQSFGRPISGGWGLPAYVHYLDGRVEAHGEQAAP